MPAFVVMLLGGLVQIAATLAGKVLIGLGFAAVTYTGLSTSLTWLKSQAVGSLQGLPADMVGLIAYMKVGEAISMIVSALAVRMVLDGLSEGGSISRLVKR
jgi:hypothetical protein